MAYELRFHVIQVVLVWLPLVVHSRRPVDTPAKQLQFPEDCGFSTDPSACADTPELSRPFGKSSSSETSFLSSNKSGNSESQWFSGRGGSTTVAMAYELRSHVIQVGEIDSLYAKKTSNRCLLLLPRPQVLYVLSRECTNALCSLLLCCGDVEANPGPPKKTPGPLDDVENNTASSDARHKEVMAMLSKISARCDSSAVEQSNLAEAIDEVKANQQLVASKLCEIERRLSTVELRTNSVADIEKELQVANEAIGSITQTNDALVSRLNDLEDRARRCNLVFFGMPDKNKTWQATEEALTNLLSSSLGAEFDPNAVEKAHRLGGPYIREKTLPSDSKICKP
ncbi:hypothetical protein HPB51_017634 [Rhipicephalus microplus]|uniref:Tick transposon n=1 Tax=Rhipicephalus microplus TaxID=6941 RepID=A0A9J6EIV9_RHIMP|nr:hypothetical protein HPB51_017634 [Rhipicephalus microplus]